MKKAYIRSAVAAGSLAVVATLIISLSSNTGMTGSGAPKSVSPHIDQSRVPHLPPSGQGQPTPSIQQGTPGKAGSPQQVPAPQRQGIAYELEQPNTLPPEQQPDPTQDPLMPPKQKLKADQPPVQRQLVAQGAEQAEQQNPYMPPIQQPMPSYGTQQQQMEQRQVDQQQIQNYNYQTEPQIIEQTPPESCPPPPAETIPNAPSSFQPPTPVVPPTPQV